MADLRTAREWREQVACTAEYIDGLLSVVKEGYDHMPPAADAELSHALDALDQFDRAMAKIDGADGAVGGKYRLHRELRST